MIDIDRASEFPLVELRPDDRHRNLHAHAARVDAPAQVSDPLRIVVERKEFAVESQEDRDQSAVLGRDVLLGFVRHVATGLDENRVQVLHRNADLPRLVLVQLARRDLGEIHVRLLGFAHLVVNVHELIQRHGIHEKGRNPPESDFIRLGLAFHIGSSISMD